MNCCNNEKCNVNAMKSNEKCNEKAIMGEFAIVEGLMKSNEKCNENAMKMQ